MTSHDGAGSSVVAFILSMLLVGSLMTYVATTNRSNARQHERAEAMDLDAQAAGALADLAQTPGQPTDWEADPATLRFMGVADPHDHYRVLPEKLAALQDGDVDGDDFHEALGIDQVALSGALAGALTPFVGAEAVARKAVAVVHYMSADPTLRIVADDDLQLARDAGAAGLDLAGTEHDWNFAWTADMLQGVGDVFADHPWSVQFELIPRLAGMAATYSNIDNLGTPSALAEKTAFDKFMGLLPGGKRTVAHWRVVEEGTPAVLPGGGAAHAHAMTVNFRHETGGDGGNGVGQWRTLAGHRSWAAIGPLNVTDADSARLEFTHFLRFSAIPTFTDRARILSWSGGTWTRLQAAPPCAPGGIGWANADADDTPSNAWETKSIDLCEALGASGGQPMYLAFYWDSFCGLEAAQTPCNDSGAGRDNAWFIDDIRVTVTEGGVTDTVVETNFEPPYGDGAQVLFIGQGVDHAQPTTAPTPALSVDYFVDFVRAGGSVIAMAPGAAGDWLVQLGLEADPPSPREPIGEVEDAEVLHTPNELSELVFKRSEPVAWASAASSARGSPTNQLTMLHGVTLDATAMTMGIGRPQATGGIVAAIAYDVSQDAALRNALLENLIAAVTLPPLSFDAVGAEPPGGADAHSVQVRRLVVVPVDGGPGRSATVALQLELWDMARDEGLT